MGDFVYSFIKRLFKVLISSILIIAILISAFEVYFGNLRAKRAHNYTNLCGYIYLQNYNADLQSVANDTNIPNSVYESEQVRGRIVTFSKNLRAFDSNFAFIKDLEDVNLRYDRRYDRTGFALVPQDMGVSYIDIDYINARDHFPEHAVTMLGDGKSKGHFYTGAHYASYNNYFRSTDVWNNGLFEIDISTVKAKVIPDATTGRPYTIYSMNNPNLKQYLYGTIADAGRDTADTGSNVVVSNDIVTYIVQFEYDIVIPYFFAFTQRLTGDYGIKKHIVIQERYFVTR